MSTHGGGGAQRKPSGVRESGRSRDPASAPLGIPALSQEETATADRLQAAFDREPGRPYYSTREKVEHDLAVRLVRNADFHRLSRDFAQARGVRGYKTTEQTVHYLLRAWGEGSNSRVSSALQHAARTELGLTTSAVRPTAPVSFKEDRDAFAGELRTLGSVLASGNHDGALRAYVRAVYDNTQAWLRREGVSGVTAYRGMNAVSGEHLPTGLTWYAGSPTGYRHPDWQRISDTSSPLTSWAISRYSAQQFAARTDLGIQQWGEHGVVEAAHVPASRIWSTPQTGPGANHENEIVVLGGRDSVLARGYKMPNDEY